MIDVERTATPSHWHALSGDQALTQLAASANGLSEREAELRLERYGANRITAVKRVSAFALLLGQLRSVVVLLLCAAVVVALIAGEYIEAFAIVGVLFINTLIGFVVELRARRSMDMLLHNTDAVTTVLRDARSRQLVASQLVPGDIVLLEAGDAVPADARLIDAVELHLNEASLTGESQPVMKDAAWMGAPATPLPDRRNSIYAGTFVLSGTARALVVATGDATELGRISLLVGSVRDTRTPLERRLDLLGRRFVWLTLVVTAVVMTIGVLQGIPLAIMLETSIALAIAAVPEGLPAVATIGLAVGLRRMARRNALIRKLHAVEALGSTTVVCTDKTGTLTANQMTITQLSFVDTRVDISGSGYEPVGDFSRDDVALDPATHAQLAAALDIAGRTAHARVVATDGQWSAQGDPTDAALHVLARKAANAAAIPDTPVAQLPFSSSRLLSAEFFRMPDGSCRAYVKGAPNRVLDKCARALTAAGDVSLADAERNAIRAANDAMAAAGLRVIALAQGTVRDSSEASLSALTWVALAGMMDAPAAGVQTTIATFREAGIRTVMITGDQRLTATAIARQVGLAVAADQTLDAGDLRLPGAEALRDRLGNVSVFSRASPEDKFAIVTALQQRGEIVAMLGDGVNDAAALKKADVGVAMGIRGTDVAKNVADVVLQDDRFATIGAAIEEGRAIYDNIRKFIFYLFSCNLAEVVVLFVAGAAGLPLPAAPLQILWLNLVTDTFPALALAFEPPEPDLMKRRPRDPRAAILSWRFTRATSFYAVLIASSTAAAFLWARHDGQDYERAISIAFMTLAFAQVAHLGNARSTSAVLSPVRALANRYAIAAVAIVIMLQLLAVYFPPLAALLHTHPLTYIEWIVVGLLGAFPAVIGQLLHGRSRSGDKLTPAPVSSPS